MLLEEQLLSLLNNQYLQPPPTPKPRKEFDLEELFNIANSDFCEAARTTMDRFIKVLEKIFLNPVFHQSSIRAQLLIAHQLALKLERIKWEWHLRENSHAILM